MFKVFSSDTIAKPEASLGVITFEWRLAGCRNNGDYKK
jgi:hypothetical protein